MTVDGLVLIVTEISFRGLQGNFTVMQRAIDGVKVNIECNSDEVAVIAFRYNLL